MTNINSSGITASSGEKPSHSEKTSWFLEAGTTSSREITRSRNIRFKQRAIDRRCIASRQISSEGTGGQFGNLCHRDHAEKEKITQVDRGPLGKGTTDYFAFE